MNRLTYSICFVLFLLVQIVLIALGNNLYDLDAVRAIYVIRLIIVACFIFFCAANRLKNCGKNPFLSLVCVLRNIGSHNSHSGII